jgi:prepilin-type N-terminal cleavage/methylation domain-containing protein
MSGINKTSTQGFTIVELLIVIVVIAILAAITITAYNGIQMRANNTQTTQAIKDYIKAYSLYALDNNDYPNQTGCLGEGYPGGRCLAQGASGFCFGYGGATNPGVNAALKPYMNNNAANPSMQAINCGSTSYIGAYAAYTAATKTVIILMSLKGDQPCPPMSPNVSSTSKSQQDDLTLCRYNLLAAG